MVKIIFLIDIKHNYLKKEMTLNDQILQIQMNLDQAKEHIVQLEAGRKASSAKARSALQKIKVLAHELRKACMITQKAIPVRAKGKMIPFEYVEPPVPVLPPEPAETPKPAKKPRKSKKTQ